MSKQVTNPYKGIRDWFNKAKQGVDKFFRDVAYEINTPAAQQLPPNERWKVDKERFPEPVQDDRKEELQFKLIDKFNERVRGFAGDLKAGRRSTAEFHARMVLEIRNLHTANTVAGAGGWGAMDSTQFDKLEERINKQVNYLDNWILRLDSTDPELWSEKQIGYQATLYGGASTESFFEGLAHAHGIPALPTQPAHRTICRTNCKCRWEITKLAGEGNWNIRWIRSPVESCPTCLARETAFNPLKIRNFIIQPFNEIGIYADN